MPIPHISSRVVSGSSTWGSEAKMVMALVCAATRDSRAATSAMTSRTYSDTLLSAAFANASSSAFVASSNRMERVTVLTAMYDSLYLMSREPLTAKIESYIAVWMSLSTVSGSRTDSTTIDHWLCAGVQLEDNRWTVSVDNN